MCLKVNGYSFGVFLIYSVTLISLPSGSWCEPPPHPAEPNSQLDPRYVRNRGVTTTSLPHPSRTEGGKGQQLDPGQVDEDWAHPPVFYQLEKNRDGAQTKPPAGARPERRLWTRMAPSVRDRRFRKRHKQTEEVWGFYSLHCSEGKIQQVTYGRFYIVGQLEPNVPSVGSQSGSAGPGQAMRIQGQQVRGSEQSWQRLQPVVECGDDAMTLTVRQRRAVQLQLDPVNEPSVPLSQLPPQCGYSVQTTPRDLSLTVQHSACHVSQEDDHYVLPLLWRGTPVKISCPVSRVQPQDTGPSSLCCSSYGMTVKVHRQSAAEELRVNVRGDWTPLAVLVEQCGYTLDRRHAEIVITAPFITCGVTVKDGKHTLSLQIGEKTFTLSCPVSTHEELPQTQEPLIDLSHYRTREPTETMPESTEPFLWAPPFYLAPLYHPHPTNRHTYPRPYVYDAYNPDNPPPSAPHPIFDPQPLPDSQDWPEIPLRWSNKHFSVHSSLSSTDAMEDSSRAYLDLQQETPILSVPESGSATTSGFLTETPSLQPPGHAFNPYYHYYNHPKIPLPGPAQNPDPGPEVPEERPSSEVNSDQFHQPVLGTFPAGPELSHKAPEPRGLYPPHLYPFYYFPYISVGGAKRVAPPHPDMAAETNVSLVRPHKHNTSPFIDHPNEKYNPEWIKHPFLPADDVKPALEDEVRHFSPVTPLPPSYSPEPVPIPPPEQPSVPPPLSNHNPPPYPHYLSPYYQHYYYGPGTLQSAEKYPSPTAYEHQTLIDDQNSLLNPYYYYYNLYYHPKVPAHNQDLHPAGAVDSGKAGSQLPSDNSRMDQLAHVGEAESAGAPQPLYSPVQSFYPYHVAQEHPHDLFGRPNGQEGCTVEQHLVLVVPDCLLAPSEVSNASCTLENLTFDPGVYIVPLDGCGDPQHVFGQGGVHLLHGTPSHQPDYTFLLENSPVRLMVECGSSPGSPAEVVVDPPPPPPAQAAPATVTVQLRIATDQSFTSYHPEAHLPLSLMRGRPLHLEVSLLDPPEPDLVLLVRSCLAYTHTPYTSWMLVYDGCSGQDDPQLLPPQHIRRIEISSFLSLPTEGLSVAKGGSSYLEDPEIYFLCLTQLCFATDDDCTVTCTSKNIARVRKWQVVY